MPCINFTGQNIQILPDETKGGLIVATGFSDFSNGRVNFLPNGGRLASLVPEIDRGLNQNAESGQIRRIIHQPGTYIAFSYVPNTRQIEYEIKFTLEIEQDLYTITFLQIPWDVNILVHHREGGIDEYRPNTLLPTVLKVRINPGDPADLRSLKSRLFDNHVIKYDDRPPPPPSRFGRIQGWDDD